jgi:hypothetical protein
MACHLIDNAMPAEYCATLNAVLSGQDFEWYNQQIMVYDDVETELPFFAHCAYIDHTPRSRHFELFRPLVERLDTKALLRIRINNFPRWSEIVEHGWHVDYPDSDHKTAIYYVNDNNGSTLVEGQEPIRSVANRLLLIDGGMKHSSTSHTDTNHRYTVVVNYL